MRLVLDYGSVWADQARLGLSAHAGRGESRDDAALIAQGFVSALVADPAFAGATIDFRRSPYEEHDQVRVEGLPLSTFDAGVGTLHRLLACADALGVGHAGVPIADVATWAFRREHDPLVEWGRVPDEERFARLRELRARALAPWLDGRYPVRDLAAFHEWHLAMSGAMQLVARSTLTSRALSIATTACRWGCAHPERYEEARAALAAGGWITEAPLTGGVPRIGIGKGPRLARLNRGAGELLEL